MEIGIQIRMFWTNGHIQLEKLLGNYLLLIYVSFFYSIFCEVRVKLANIAKAVNALRSSNLLYINILVFT